VRRPLALVVAALAVSPTARAVELHLLGGLDLLAVNQPSSASPELIELGLGLRSDLRDPAHGLSARLDFEANTPLVGDDLARYRLRELSLRAELLAGRLRFTVGRFPLPGGYWLIADGGQVGTRLGPLSISGYGGLRAFTGGRDDATFNGVILPLAGAQVAIDHEIVHGSLSFTWARDRVALERGYTPSSGAFSPDGTTDGTPLVSSSDQDQLFLDAQLVVLPHPTLFLAGGASLATRYQVTYLSGPPGTNWVAAPTVDAKPLSAFMAYALVEWRPLKRLRLSYAFDFDRVQLVTPVLPLDNTLTAAGGSFEDHTLKASARVWRTLRLEARYRLRFRENTDVIHRVEGGFSGDDLIYHFGAFATVGADLYQDRSGGNPGRCPSAPMGTSSCGTVIYTGGLSYVRPELDARAGLLYTDAIGSGVLFSTHAMQALGSGPTSELFPLVLSAQRIAFVRLFATFRRIFVGLDAELDLDASQTRVLAQAGYQQ
jgi:hypothetical protein